MDVELKARRTQGREQRKGAGVQEARCGCACARGSPRACCALYKTLEEADTGAASPMNAGPRSPCTDRGSALPGVLLSCPMASPCVTACDRLVLPLKLPRPGGASAHGRPFPARLPWDPLYLLPPGGLAVCFRSAGSGPPAPALRGRCPPRGSEHITALSPPPHSACPGPALFLKTVPPTPALHR